MSRVEAENALITGSARATGCAFAQTYNVDGGNWMS
jgi:hypothetical protein